MEESKISVIVPVYKVEPYLLRCLDSLVTQTYQNLEIILVDDGSPDNCGAICDGCAARDGRIRVIHKENGGVSSARNTGLAAAAGEWIGWVDGDDWIEPDLYENMLQKAVEHGADIVVCGWREEYPDRTAFWGWDELQVWNREQALGLLVEDKTMRSYLCDKLWRRELLEGIVFPEGRIYEDTMTVFQFFRRAETVIGIPGAGYHYRQRSGSIVSTRNLAQQVAYFQAVRYRLELLGAEYPQLVPQMELQCAQGCHGVWSEYSMTPRAAREKLRPELREMAEFSKECKKRVLARGDLGLAGRILTRLTAYDAWWAFVLAGLVNWLYKIKHRMPL